MTGARRDPDAGTTVLELEGGETVRASASWSRSDGAARVGGIGLESVGVETDGDPIEVDERMRVGGRDWLYAIGDVNGRAQLTHMGKYQARVAAENILGRDAVASRDDERSPRVVFTDPEVAAVGYTFEGATRGRAVRERRRRRHLPGPPAPASTVATPTGRAGS